VNLTNRFTRQPDEFRAATAILTLKVALLPVSVLEIVHVVLVELPGVDGWIAAQLLLPPADGVFEGEAAVLQEGSQLKPPCVLQVLLGLPLPFYKPPHAGRQRAGEEILEVAEVQLLAGFLRGRGAHGQHQLHAHLLQLPQEETHSRIGQGHVDA